MTPCPRVPSRTCLPSRVGTCRASRHVGSRASPPGRAATDVGPALPWRMTGAQLGLDVCRVPASVRVTPARLAHLGRLPAPLPAHLPRPARAAPVRRAGGEHARRGRPPGAAVALRAAAPRGARRTRRPGWSTGTGPARASATPSRPHDYRERARGWLAEYAEGAARRRRRSGWSSGCRWPSAGSSPRAGSTASTGAATSWSSSTTRPGARRPHDDARRSPGARALRPRRRAHAAAAAALEVELHHVPSGQVVGVAARRGLARRARRGRGRRSGLAALADARQAGGDPDVLFPPRPAPRCGSCDVRRHCPEGRAAAPERRAVGVSWNRDPHRAPVGASLVRGLSGVLVGGLVALAVVLLAAWFVRRPRRAPRPRGRHARRPPVAAAVAVAGAGLGGPHGRTASERWPPLARSVAVVVGGLTLVWLF